MDKASLTLAYLIARPSIVRRNRLIDTIGVINRAFSVVGYDKAFHDTSPLILLQNRIDRAAPDLWHITPQPRL